ncbi:PepK [Acidianus ambivalens]|uniref:PepK n=1 Tax=Acidianus ambivalens TaxID=2283 RepID=A0A6G1T6V3_ACIAM|nr:PepK [Acidianus ambivalens]
MSEKLDRILGILNKKVKTTRDLDSLYDKMKDSLGYVRIDNLRRELGMSLEEFLSTFGDYIEKHYELIPGGDEGFIRNGVRYGIIRRKY